MYSWRTRDFVDGQYDSKNLPSTAAFPQAFSWQHDMK